MFRLERQRVVMLVAALEILCCLVSGGPGLARGDEGSDWKKPFRPDQHTVVLYHFDEGRGNEAYDACGDATLTLRAHKTALWGSRPGFGTTALFEPEEFVKGNDEVKIASEKLLTLLGDQLKSLKKYKSDW